MRDTEAKRSLAVSASFYARLLIRSCGNSDYPQLSNLYVDDAAHPATATDHNGDLSGWISNSTYFKHLDPHPEAAVVLGRVLPLSLYRIAESALVLILRSYCFCVPGSNHHRLKPGNDKSRYRETPEQLRRHP